MNSSNDSCTIAILHIHVLFGLVLLMVESLSSSMRKPFLIITFRQSLAFCVIALSVCKTALSVPCMARALSILIFPSVSPYFVSMSFMVLSPTSHHHDKGRAILALPCRLT